MGLADRLAVERERIWNIKDDLGQCLIDNGVLPYIGKTESHRLEKGWELGILFWRYLWRFQVGSEYEAFQRGSPHLFDSSPLCGHFWFFLTFPHYAVTVTVRGCGQPPRVFMCVWDFCKIYFHMWFLCPSYIPFYSFSFWLHLMPILYIP